MSDDRDDIDNFEDETTVQGEKPSSSGMKTQIGMVANIVAPPGSRNATENEFADTIDTPITVEDQPPTSTLIAASPPPPEVLAAMAKEKAARDKARAEAKNAAATTGPETSAPAAPKSTSVRGSGGGATPTPMPFAPHGESIADARVGGDLGGYHIIRKLAEGGMGVVYEAEHSKIGRKGAIKVLKAEFCQDPRIVERFYQEARAVNEIGHDNIVDIFDFGKTPEGGVFFVMEFLEGLALSDRLRKSKLKWSESLDILKQTIHALVAAHKKGFVHRDLKPDNIFIETKDGANHVKLLDFGIAKLVGMEGAEEKLTQTGSMIGTPHYMSPEQINGSAAIDHRTDIYSLGIIMYEMFSGATPFQGNTLGEIITGHLLEEAPRLTDLPDDLGVPKPIADIIHRMLAKKPEERYDSLEDVLSDLGHIDENRAPETAVALAQSRPMTAAVATRSSGPRPAASAPPSSRAWLPIAGVGAVALAAGAVFFLTRGSGDKKQQSTVPPAATETATSTEPAKPEDPGPDFDAVRADAQALIRSALEQAAPGIRVRGSDAAGDTLDPGSAAKLFELAQSDPSEEVRGHAASALGKIGHADAYEAFRKLEKKAAVALQPWYAQALHSLGDESARKRLLKYANSKDLAVAFKSSLIVAEISEPGDKGAISALTKLASREAELNEVVPYAGALLLAKLAQLRSPGARKILYSILEQEDEGARFAAAEGLARLGDDGGAELLSKTVEETESPNRLRAAVTLVLLGDYSGYEVLDDNLDSEDAMARAQAAQGMGYLGESRSLESLLPLLEDKDWNVRVASAVALMAIVGMDPALLAQASVDWTRSALNSEDWTKREEAADVLGELPEKQAVPLLAQAIADSSPQVRVAAARSARKLKSAEAARHVAEAALAEKDEVAREEQVKALGAIGQAESAETLRTLTNDKGRVGVFAAGSLIAVGDTSGKERLQEAVSDKRTTIRLAAVEAASSAGNDTVVPVLTTGVGDKVFDVRFTASEGLSVYGAEKALAVPVLESGLKSKSVSVQARAQVGLMRYGEAAVETLSIDELLDSSDPENRLAALQVLKAQDWSEARPKMMRLVADPDVKVRRASVDVLDHFVAKNKESVKAIYKSLTKDSDTVTRSKAQARLSLLVEPPPKKVEELVPQPATPPPAAGIDAGAELSAEDLARVQKTLDDLGAANATAKTELAAMQKEREQLDEVMAEASPDEGDLAKARRGARALRTSATAMEDRATSLGSELDAIVGLVGDVGGDAGAKLKQAQALHAELAATVAAARELGANAQTASDAFAERAGTVETPPSTPDAGPAAPPPAADPTEVLAKAQAALDAGKLSQVRKYIKEAKALYKKSGSDEDPTVLFLEGMLYRKQSDAMTDAEQRTRTLRKSQESFFKFLRKGTEPQLTKAREQLAEIGPMLSDLLMAPEGEEAEETAPSDSKDAPKEESPPAGTP